MLTIGDESRQVKVGDIYIIPGEVDHGVTVGDQPAQAFEVFSPVARRIQVPVSTEPSGSSPPREFDWAIWLEWVALTAIGWLIAWALTGTTWWIGAAIGLLQWLVIRRAVDRQGLWVIATTVGWIMGWMIAQALFGADATVWSWPVVGAMTGAMQWVVLQRKVRGAFWWPVLSALAWAVGQFSGVGFYLMGAVAGAITGIAMELFVRQVE